MLQFVHVKFSVIAAHYCLLTAALRPPPGPPPPNNFYAHLRSNPEGPPGKIDLHLAKHKLATNTENINKKTSNKQSILLGLSYSHQSYCMHHEIDTILINLARRELFDIG